MKICIFASLLKCSVWLNVASLNFIYKKLYISKLCRRFTR